MAIENNTAGPTGGHFQSNHEIVESIDVGGIKIKIKDSNKVISNADRISKLVTDQNESRKVYAELIKLGQDILTSKDEPSNEPPIV